MRYVVLIAAAPGRWEVANDAERQEYIDRHAAFHAAIDERGTRVEQEALADADIATTLRHTGSGWAVTDGPFVELTEQIAGFYLVEMPDLDALIDACRLLPPAYTLEIRPVVEVPPR